MIRSATAGPNRAALSRWGALTALMLISPAALAQSGADQAAADALYNEGRALLKAGQRAAGCAKFEASLALSPATSTMLNIARCHEQDGKIATALGDYTRALYLNRDTPGVERRTALEQIARAGISALTPRVPKLRVVLTAPPPGLEVWSDGKAIPPAALGEALPVDPGQHEVRASAPGYLPVTRSVSVEEGKSVELPLTLTRAPAPTTEPRRPTPAPTGSWSRPLGIALTSVGAAGLVVGTVTGIVSLRKVNAIWMDCGGPICSPKNSADSDPLEFAKLLGNVSTASFIAGGAFAAAGIALLVVHPGDGHVSPDGGVHSATSPVSVRLSLGLGGLGVEGSF